MFKCYSIYLRVGGDEVRMMVWDTAGQEEFDTITRAYYRWDLMCSTIESVNSVGFWRLIARRWFF